VRGFQTLDGGKHWTPIELGRAVNKIRVLKTPNGFVACAIGVDVHKLEYPPAAAAGSEGGKAP
jgi:hypothetical protein